MTNVNAEQFSTQKEYYEYLRKLCLKIKNNQLKIGQNVIKTVYPFLRNYKIEIEGDFLYGDRSAINVKCNICC